MGFFSKREVVPEIPPAPKLPELRSPPKLEGKPQELHPPHKNLGQNLNQEMVKSAVDGPVKEREVKHLPQTHAPAPQEKGMIPSRKLPPIPHKELVHEKRTLELSPEIKPTTRKSETIFVRIDKFQTAKKDFIEVKEKIKEIESTLHKVNESRIKEEAEISEWMRDLERIKARLSEIDSKIFDKI